MSSEDKKVTSKKIIKSYIFQKNIKEVGVRSLVVGGVAGLISLNPATGVSIGVGTALYHFIKLVREAKKEVIAKNNQIEAPKDKKINISIVFKK